MHNSHQYTNQNVTIVFDLCKSIDDANKRRNVRRLIDVHAILRLLFSFKKKSTSQNNNRLRIEISKKGGHPAIVLLLLLLQLLLTIAA